MVYDKDIGDHYDIATILMSKRTEECYNLVFSELKTKLESLF